MKTYSNICTYIFAWLTPHRDNIWLEISIIFTWKLKVNLYSASIADQWHHNYAMVNVYQYHHHPRRACTARVTLLGLSICVCLSTLILALQATRRPISNTSGFRTTQAWKLKRRFSLNDCVQEICPDNKRKSQYANRTGLPQPDPLAVCTLEAQEVTTKGVYQLSRAIYYCSSPCQTLHELQAGDPK